MKASVLDDLRRIESELRSVRRSAQLGLLRQRGGIQLLCGLRGGGNNALDAPTAQRQGSRDDDAFVESVQERLREDGARAPDKAFVKPAIALARDYEETFKPDNAWWDAWAVKPGGARTRVIKYKDRILEKKLLLPAAEPPPFPSNPRHFFAEHDRYPLPLPAPPLAPPLAPPPPPPSLEEQANTVQAEIDRLDAEREAHLAAAQEAEEELRPLRRRLQHINHQRMMAGWGAARPAHREATTGPTHCERAASLPVAVAAKSPSLSPSEEMAHAEIDEVDQRLPPTPSQSPPTPSGARFEQVNRYSQALQTAGPGASAETLLYMLR